MEPEDKGSLLGDLLIFFVGFVCGMAAAFLAALYLAAWAMGE